MNKLIVSAQLTEPQTKWFFKRQDENHKTNTEFMQTIVSAYMQFEEQGYLNKDGTTMSNLQNAVFFREKLRQADAGILHDKVEAQKELNRLKEEDRKARARDRAHRNAPHVDWGSSAGVESF